MLKPLLFVSAVTLFALAAPTAPGRAPQEPAPAPAAPAAKSNIKTSPELQARAKKIYAVDCALCHNANGDGKSDLAKDMQLTLLDWTDASTLANKPDKELFDAIRKGKGKMPPEDASRAKDDEVWNLVLYIRDLPKQQPAAPAAPAASPAPAAPTAPTAPGK